ncbi:hypothetical protein [Fodinicola acaciae]|uniref:hypothetical protein n=1 Tax=Fodinicola acaciae TaxID=2681555 RepID=UPI0013D70D8F|nr:hypothetical protein [Fodinicola acaciae]
MTVRPRWLVFWGIVWTAAYAWTYVVTVQRLGGVPAAWYVAALVVAGLALLVALFNWSWRPALIAGTALLAFCTVIAIASLGWFLLPAVIFAGFPIGMKRPGAVGQDQGHDDEPDHRPAEPPSAG